MVHKSYYSLSSSTEFISAERFTYAFYALLENEMDNYKPFNFINFLYFFLYLCYSAI